MSLYATFTRLLQASRHTPVVPWSVRKDRLTRLQTLLLQNKDAIAEAISQDFGHRSKDETAFLELFTSLETIKHALAHTPAWMKPKRKPTAIWFKPASNTLMAQPLGVIGIIVPWNYPLLLAISPMVGAIAAGNRVMIKLSELSPAFGLLFQSLIHATFSDDEVRVVLGDVDVGQAFSALPFDHLLFTGSTEVGAHVMRAASSNLTPVTLELGGKSPALVAPDANLQHAATRIIYGKLLNAGQTCIAPDYVLLPKGQEGAFIAAAKAVTARHYPELMETSHTPRDYTSMASARHFKRMQDLLDEAIAYNGTVHPLSSNTPNPTTRVFPPMIVTNLPVIARLVKEEIFGPILPIVTYDKLEDALVYISNKPRPLALYVFSGEKTTIDQVLQQTVSGGVTVNDTLLHIAQENMPFGGVGASGMGAYHGRYGFDTFSHLKPVFKQHRFNTMGLFTPPYKKTFARLLSFLIR
jgi:coniferyl-aldehyde dehydrogenase